MSRGERPSAQALLAELGFEPRLTVYLASAPGAGKTYRILSDVRFQRKAGRRVAIGWIETKDRPDLADLARDLPRIPPRAFDIGGNVFLDFDLEAAIASDYETIVLDELAHANPDGATNAKRWQDALALRAAGKSVLGAFNVQHLESVAPVAERIVGHPVREIVPLSFLKAADGVIALDVSASILESRLRAGRIVRPTDIERAANGAFKRQNLNLLRELLLQTVDQLTIPVTSPAKTSTALAILTDDVDERSFLRRVASLADALDLALETTTIAPLQAESVAEASRAFDVVAIPAPKGLERGDLREVRAAFVTVGRGPLATKILSRAIDRDLYVVDPSRTLLARVADRAGHPYGQAAGDRMRIGYGRLTIYLGSVAGSGKTYAMLDRAHQLVEEGTDVVAGLIETHGRVDTIEKAVGLETLPRLPNGELDRDAIVARKPAVVLVDELAHTNATGGTYAKRYDDVISILRAGISVMTTLNIQHLDGLSDAVERLTETHVRETLPDTILELADEVIFIDVTPDVIRDRLRAGRIYPLERVDAALANFFRADNLAALRELTVRELLRARRERRLAPPFSRIVLGVAPRERDVGLIERMGRLARRLSVDLKVVHVSTDASASLELITLLERATKAAHGKWRVLIERDVAAGLVAACDSSDVIACESPRTNRPPWGKKSFAARLIAADARELLVLAPR